jgi:hypothetical protein
MGDFMRKSYGLIGAASLCLFMASGCALDSFSLTAFTASKGDGPVVQGSLNAVASTAQKAMGEMGLFVSVRRDAESAKLTSTTPSGKRFTLVLKAHKTDHGDETQVSIQWEKEADQAFWLQLTAAVVAPKSEQTPLKPPVAS